MDISQLIILQFIAYLLTEFNFRPEKKFNQFDAVGFLIAAKSILRFKDDNTLKTEYVLIGTMLSFGIAIACGLLINLT
jgi:hypothetical protein